jgi:excisionase family DNA binding protein
MSRIRESVTKTPNRQGETTKVLPIALPIAAAAQYLGVAPRQIRLLKDAHEIPAVRLGKRHVFRIVDLQAFLDRKAREAA